jgi:opacity protein-like surface antigen
MTSSLPSLRAGARVLLAALGLLAAAPAAAGPWTGNVSAFAGRKRMDRDNWDPVKELRAIGVLIDFRDHERYPLSVAIDLFRGRGGDEKNDFNLDAETYELHLGARKIWNDKDEGTWFRPYLGAGLSLAEADVSLKSFDAPAQDDRGWGVGVWAGGGLYWSPFRNFNIGVDARWSKAPVKLLGESFDAGGIHVGILVGWRWLAI